MPYSIIFDGSFHMHSLYKALLKVLGKAASYELHVFAALTMIFRLQLRQIQCHVVIISFFSKKNWCSY